jgi:hypothetical protein
MYVRKCCDSKLRCFGTNSGADVIILKGKKGMMDVHVVPKPVDTACWKFVRRILISNFLCKKSYLVRLHLGSFLYKIGRFFVQNWALFSQNVWSHWMPIKNIESKTSHSIVTLQTLHSYSITTCQTLHSYSIKTS